MASKSLKELKVILENDLEYQLNNIENFKGNENPQIKEMYNNSIVRAEAIKDILEYIKTGAKCQFSKMDL